MAAWQLAAPPCSGSWCAAPRAARNSSAGRRPPSVASARPGGSSRRVVARAQQQDLYVNAVHRLFSLINGVGDGEDEMYSIMLAEEEPTSKLGVNAVLGAVCLTASTAICWLCGKDPAGGASLSLHSLAAAAVGAAAALPLVAYRVTSWQPDAAAANPTLGALRRAQTEAAKPWLAGMSGPQLGLHTALDTLPPLFLMLPAAQAGLTSSFAFTSAALGAATGVELPPAAGFALALGMTGLVTAAVRSTDFVSDPEQVRVVSDAVANADRFYRLTSSSIPSSSDASSSSWSAEQEASAAALAFKAVAVSWRELEQEMTRLFMTLQVLDFVYLGVLWHATGDMTAPCVAALLANAVDYHSMWSRLQSASGGGSGGAGGSRSSPSSKQQQQRRPHNSTDSSSLRD